MKKFKQIFLAALIMAAVIGAISACGTEPAREFSPAVKEILAEDGEWLENYEEFYRLDRDTTTAWEEELEAVRIMSEGRYELGEAKEKYNLDPDYDISLEGLDTLYASASAQFSERQFRELAEDLRQAADGKEIIIVDLREESHYMLNGISVSLFRLHNWANLGLTPEEVAEAEEAAFADLKGKTITAYGEDDELKLEHESLEFTVETVMSEKELVESEGFTYLRIACTDHVWPDPWEIDQFIEYVKGVDTDDVWFHFHCQGGSGRTGAFMMIYDKMKNPHVDDKDILYRHAKTGSNYPLYLGDGDSYKDPLYKEKAEMAPLIFDYIEQNHESNYEVSWSQWLEQK